DGDVQAGQANVFDGRGVHAPGEDTDAWNLFQPHEVADSAINHHAALRLIGDGRAQVIAGEGAVLHLAPHVHDHHVTLDQRVDDIGVVQPHAAPCAAPFVHQLVQVRTRRHAVGGDRAPHQHVL